VAWALSQVRALSPLSLSLSPSSVCSLNVCLGILTLYPARTIVLYGLGTVVSLIGTGFLIGVRLNFFFVGLLMLMLMLSKFYVQIENSSASS
jgi:hypothetical protein